MTEKLQEILFACLALPEAEWGAAVEEACAQHPQWAESLRARFQSLVAFGMADDGASPRRLGEYELLQPLGGGAMGTVFLARRASAGEEVAGERFAVKVLQPGLQFSSAAQARFARERAIVSRLRHPGLCEVRDAGVADGVPYLAMEFIEGEDLSLWIRRRAAASELPTPDEQRDLVRLLAQVARALQAAHDAGLLHRDVKPGNIMVRQSDQQPVLLDFGLARELEDRGARLTGSGSWVGSPAYLAPETLAGTRTHDARADVYAVGVTLFECVTLRLPYQGPTREALFHAILRGRFPDPRRLHDGVLPELAHVLRVAMARLPRQRYASAAALAADLEALAGGEPVSVRAPSLLERGVALARRRPIAAGFVATLMVALAVTVLVLREITASFDRVRALGLASAAANATPESAVVLSRRAVRLLEHPATVSELHAAVARYHRRTESPPAPERIERVNFLPEAVGLWARTPSGALQVLGSEGEVIAQLAGVIDAVALDPDRIVFADADGLACWRRDGETSRWSDGVVRALGLWRGAIWWVVELPSGLVLRRRSLEPGSVRPPPISLPDGPWENVEFGGGWVFLSRPGEILRVWHTGERVGACPGQRLLARAADGSAWIVEAAHGAAVWFRQPTTAGREPQSVRTFGPEFRRFVFAPSGEALAALRDREALRIFDREARLIGAVPSQGVWVESFEFSPDGQTLAVGGGDGVVRLCARDGAMRGALHGHRGHVTCLAFRADGEELATGSYDRRVRRFAVRPSQGHLLSGGGASAVVRVDAGAAGRVLWLDGDGALRFDGERKPRATGVAEARFCGPDRSQVFALEATGRAWVEPGAQGAAAAADRLRLGTVSAPARDLAVSAQGRRVVAATADGQIGTWALGSAGWERGRSLDSGMGASLRCVAIADDGMMVGGNASGWIQVLHPDGTPGRRFQAHGDWLWSVRIDAGGAILTTSRDNTARLWREGQQEPITFRGHEGTLARGVFSPDGKWIATASTDRTVRLWTRTGSLIAILRGHGGQVWDAAFDLDGRSLVSGGFDRQVRRWLVRTDDLLHLADALVPRTPTATELSMFAR